MDKIALLLLAALPLSAAAQHKRYHGDGVDDYLRFAPIAAVAALKACGVENGRGWAETGLYAAGSVAATSGVVWGLKHVVDKRRPDGTDNRSFPSGHAAFAFAGAAILHKEFGKVSPWITAGGYCIAAATAADRVRRNRHGWADVAAGAAIGILGTEAVYWLGGKLSKGGAEYSVAPTPGGVCVAVNF